MVTPYMDNMAVKLKCKSWNIYNAWYQIYKKEIRIEYKLFLSGYFIE